MSGPFALMAAAARPDVIRAAASFHGVRLAVDADDSPHRHLPNTAANLYVGAAETDHWAPPEIISEFERAVAAAQVPCEVEWYPGTEHGFVFPGRPAYDKASAERHWSRLHDLLHTSLG